MKRILTTIRWDATLQARNGFYAATAAVTAFWALVLLQAQDFDWSRLLPSMLVGNLLIGTFYFIGALVLLERGEDTLRGLVVTPLRVGEYLLSKVLTLSALALAETAVLAFLTTGAGINWGLLLAGSAMSAAIYCLVGFIIVVRYSSINAYLLPSSLYIGLLWLPLIASLFQWRPWPFYLHPMTTPLALVEAALERGPWWYAPYGLLYGGLWVALLSVWSGRAFRRWLIEQR